MLEGVLVPNAIGIEDKDFLSLHISEDEIRVEHVDSEEHLTRDDFCVDLLQVLNVDNDSAHIAKEVTLVENYLLGVREKFRMECEVI